MRWAGASAATRPFGLDPTAKCHPWRRTDVLFRRVTEQVLRRLLRVNLSFLLSIITPLPDYSALITNSEAVSPSNGGKARRK